MNSYVKLVFTTREGKDFSLTVPDTKSSFPEDTVKDAMDLIKTASIVGGGKYQLTGNRAAYLYRTNIRTVDLKEV